MIISNFALLSHHRRRQQRPFGRALQDRLVVLSSCHHRILIVNCRQGTPFYSTPRWLPKAGSSWHIRPSSVALIDCSFCLYFCQCKQGQPSCLSRHSGDFRASSRRWTELLCCGEASVRFQQRAKHAMIGACPRPRAFNADMTIASEGSYRRRAT